MSNLQVKGVPPELHDELRRRAELAGMSMRDYVLRLIRQDLRTPASDELRERIRRLPPMTTGGAEDTADLVALARVERDAELASGDSAEA